MVSHRRLGRPWKATPITATACADRRLDLQHPAVHRIQSLHDMGMGSSYNPPLAAHIAALRQRDATPIGMFYCPSRRATVGYAHLNRAMNNGYRFASPTSLVAKSDYAACSGDQNQDSDAEGTVTISSYAVGDNQQSWPCDPSGSLISTSTYNRPLLFRRHLPA